MLTSQLQSSVEVRNVRNSTFTTPYASTGWCLLMMWEKFSFSQLCRDQIWGFTLSDMKPPYPFKYETKLSAISNYGKYVHCAQLYSPVEM